MSTRSLLVFPDDSATAIVDAIARAAHSIRVKMFVFSDPQLIESIVGAKRRGLDVRVMLNPARRNGEDDNTETRRLLVEAGVSVQDSSPTFSITHEKSMVVDDSTAFVKSLNWDTKNLTVTRDYAIVTNHPNEVAEIVDCFEADWNRTPFEPGPNAHLIWCPINGRERICHFIDAAKRSLFVENERYQDAVVIERLMRAAQRGVRVHVMARPAHSLKIEKLTEGVSGMRMMSDVGIKIHKLRHLKLHGKLFLADKETAIVGSINLAPGSLDGRRELAIEVRDDDIVDRLDVVARRDWDDSHALDLSDDGLLADLRDRAEAAEALVIGGARDRDDD